jgi:membrane protein
MYYFLPNRDQSGHRKETFVGAVTATMLWALATFGFQVYLNNFGRFGVTYGAIAAVIVLLMWYFLTSLAVMIGGELAAVLERRAQERDGREAHQRAA